MQGFIRSLIPQSPVAVKSPFPTLLALLAPSFWLAAESVTTEAVGFNKVICLANSDTIVGVPLRVQGSISTRLGSAPVANGDTVNLTLVHDALPALTRHYLKFSSGARDGRWYDITANTANAVTLDLNGDNLDGVVSNDSVLIARYWTLNTLFPPAQATTDPATTGHAILASSALNRKTELLLPDLTGEGINLAPKHTYYILNGTPKTWKKLNDNSLPDFGDVILYPDTYFLVRHNRGVNQATTLRVIGEVETANLSIFLSTRTDGRQDNHIAIPRPTPVKLSGLGLDTTAFRNSTTLKTQDELLVFSNEAAARNKAPSATYYRLSTGWRKFGDGTTNHDNSTIPAGAGFLLRKAATADGASVPWQNTASY